MEEWKPLPLRLCVVQLEPLGARSQGLTLVPISAQLELTLPLPLNVSLLCPSYNPNKPADVS